MPERKFTIPDWEDLRTFLAIVDHGSYSAAARSLGLTHATVARRIAALEAALGGRALIERVRDGYAPTALGQSLIADARAMQDAAHALMQRAQAEDALRGPVRISTLSSFAEHAIAGRLAALTREHPDLEIELVGEERNVSFARADADIAVRFGAPSGGAGRSRRIGALPWSLYASPDYLAATPPTSRRLIGFSVAQSGTPPAKRLKQLNGGRPFALRCSGVHGQREAAASGAGVAMLPHHLARRDARLALVAAAPVWEQPVWLLLREDVDRVRRVRVVADYLVKVVASALG